MLKKIRNFKTSAKIMLILYILSFPLPLAYLIIGRVRYGGDEILAFTWIISTLILLLYWFFFGFKKPSDHWKQYQKPKEDE